MLSYRTHVFISDLFKMVATLVGPAYKRGSFEVVDRASGVLTSGQLEFDIKPPTEVVINLLIEITVAQTGLHIMEVTKTTDWFTPPDKQ